MNMYKLAVIMIVAVEMSDLMYCIKNTKNMECGLDMLFYNANRQRVRYV